jgi:hypothetical protein
MTATRRTLDPGFASGAVAIVTGQTKDEFLAACRDAEEVAMKDMERRIAERRAAWKRWELTR